MRFGWDREIRDALDVVWKGGMLALVLGASIWLGRAQADRQPPGTTITWPVQCIDSLGVPVEPTVPPWVRVFSGATLHATLACSAVDGDTTIGLYVATYTIADSDTGTYWVMAHYVADGLLDQVQLGSFTVGPEVPVGGPVSVSILVADVSDSSGLPNVAVSAWDEAMAVLNGSGRTNPSGIAVMSLPEASLAFRGSTWGYSVTPETLTVTAGLTDTLWASAWGLPDTSSVSGLVTVMVDLRAPVSGEPVEGVRVDARLAQGRSFPLSDAVSKAILTRGTYSDTTDAAGRAVFRVLPNPDITPAGTSYLWTIYTNPTDQFYKLIPDTADAVYLQDMEAP